MSEDIIKEYCKNQGKLRSTTKKEGGMNNHGEKTLGLIDGLYTSTNKKMFYILTEPFFIFTLQGNLHSLTSC
jgi:hypothetical protein